jgi:UDP-glucose 4-epimerase
MNVLVTGGLGLIGSNLVKKLKSENHNVITLDLKPEADYVLDISKDDLSQIKEDIDIIYHLAAQPFGRGSEEDPFKDLDFNTKGTLNVCYLAKSKNVSQVIYTSTMAVYGDNEYAWEDSDLDPLSNYAVSKLYGEFCIKKFAKDVGFKYTIFRVWNTYGPGQDISNPFKGVVSAFATQAVKGNKINVTGSLNRFRDIIYVDDVVNALKMSLTFENSNTFNLSTGVKTTIKELIDTIIKVLGKNKEDFIIENVGGHLGDQQGCVGNNKKLIKKGWEIKYDLETGINKFIEYIKNNEHNISK